MRKIIPIDLQKYRDKEWIDLPQGTHIHPKELKMMFDKNNMKSNSREYAMRITPRGTIVDEGYGTNKEVKLNKPLTYKTAKESIFTHFHPKFLLKQELDKGIVTSPPLSPDDLEIYYRESRAFSRKYPNKNSGQIHSFKIDDRGTKSDILERKKMGGYLVHEMKEIANKYRGTPKYEHAMKTIKGFPMSNNMYTAAEFNLARRGAGNVSVINVQKTQNPNKVNITKIRSTYKDEPAYELLSTLRKKRSSKSMISRINLDLNIKFNVNKLNNMLFGAKNKIKSKSKYIKNNHTFLYL